jgi:nanoRNase/pAp phosphatase (c-di-AMP/oligoRNAs hydrolase)
MAWDVTIDEHSAKALLANEMSSLICEQTLANGDANIVLLLNRNNDATFKLSIRVAEKYEFNASEFAKKFGGGGHVKAAGCTIPIETFIELYTKHSI